MTTPDSPEEIRIPKIIGFERTVSEHVTAFARSVGFEADRIEEIKTAVGEATLNAIEYASPNESADMVIVQFWLEQDAVKVSVSSKGLPFTVADAKPDLRAKLEGRDRPRGWGIYLMKQLADTVEFGFENEFTNVTMTFRHRNAHDTSRNA
jgi:serine/threonine-protein kinase RsbW